MVVFVGQPALHIMDIVDQLGDETVVAFEGRIDSKVTLALDLLLSCGGCIVQIVEVVDDVDVDLLVEG